MKPDPALFGLEFLKKLCLMLLQVCLIFLKLPKMWVT